MKIFKLIFAAGGFSIREKKTKQIQTIDQLPVPSKQLSWQSRKLQFRRNITSDFFRDSIANAEVANHCCRTNFRLYLFIRSNYVKRIYFINIT